MATTVSSHTVAQFNSPVNGDALDANIVRSNDNTLRVAYVAHDADPGIHVQSSTLASRSTASAAGSGAKWITSDHPQRLWISDGTDWHEVGGDAITVYCKATENLTRGDIVKVTGWNNGQDVVEVAKIASAADIAFGIADATVSSGALVYVINTGTVEDLNTAAFSAGDILYPNTSGGLTATKPTSGTYQPVAYVLRANASNGVLYVEFSAPRIVEAWANTASTVVQRDGSGNFTAGTITAALTGNVTGNVSGSSGSTTGNAATATALQTARNINGVSFNGTADITVTAAAGTLTGTTLASGVTASSLTSVGTLANLTVTNPISGSVTGSSGSATGNAATATALQTARNINGVSFNGTADITVAAAAGTLTGTTLASGVTASSLTSVGTLTGLTVSGTSSLNGATVINDAGADVDFRVESDGNANMLFVDASTDRVGIGTATPSDRLTVHGNPMRVGEDSTTQYVQIGSTALGGWVEQYGSVDLDVSNIGANNIKLSTNGSERARVTSVGNVKIGGTANRATTEGTKQLVLFNGTAPTGTLTNGISIYSSSGEAYVMDAAGNATLFSPHDQETNEWIFYSVHTPTGKTLRIDMERIMRFINDQFSLNAIHEV